MGCLVLAVLCFLAFSSAAWADDTNPLTGAYYGTATITSPASLGTIDLAFNLDVTGTVIQHDTSYIITEKTLLFPVVMPKIGGKDVGPRVNGTASASTFTLTTDSFPSVASGITVSRKVTLTGVSVTNGGNTISGTYTETITGLTRDTITTSGTFMLFKPVVPVASAALADLDGDGWLSRDEIRAGGKDPNVIEFSDISFAVHLYFNPQPNLKLGSSTDPTGQETYKAALSEFYGTRQ